MSKLPDVVLSSGLDCVACGGYLSMEGYYPHGTCDQCSAIFRGEREDEHDDDADEDAV
jgi:hypothetical protein